jgi:hypothetical protein
MPAHQKASSKRASPRSHPDLHVINSPVAHVLIAKTQQQRFKLIKPSCASGPIASSTTHSPQFKLAVSTSSKLAAEKFSSPLQIVIVLLNLITHRTNSAAGRACSPSLLTISTSLRMREKGRPEIAFYQRQ